MGKTNETETKKPKGSELRRSNSPKKRSKPKKKSNGIFFQIKQNQNNNRLSESCSRTTHLNRKQNDCANAETNHSWRRAELLAPRRPAKKAALCKGGERERERRETIPAGSYTTRYHSPRWEHVPIAKF